MERVAVSDGWLAAERSGAGRPLLCLHGGPGIDSSSIRVPGILGLADFGLQVVLFDQRGHGRSSALPNEGYTHERWALDVRELTAFFHWSTYALLGHSYGGFIALEHAIRWPEAVTYLVLIGTSAGPVSVPFPPVSSAEALRQLMRRQWPDMFAGADKHWPVFDQLQFTPSPFNAAFQRELPRYDLRGKVGTLTMPVLLVVGEHDWYREPMQWLADHLPRSELHVLSGVRHVPFLEAPEEFLESVRGFFTRTASAAA